MKKVLIHCCPAGLRPPHPTPFFAPHPWTRWLGITLLLGAWGLGLSAHAQFSITEFMAANNVTLNDDDGDNSDWIEIHNDGTTAASLAGWFLTDTTNNLAKWQFPATNLPPNGYLVVFASEKNRRTPGAALHTNFKLGADGEYLALVAPDGTNVVSQFAPAFPAQIDDVSYGVVRATATSTLLGPGAPVRAFVPPNDNLGLTWTAAEFNDAAWTNGTTGIGYDRQTLGVNFLPLLGLNVEAMMYPNNASLYARIPFDVANPAAFSGLNLRMKFDDGFIAYLNGQEIARSNAPLNATFNSNALAPRTDTAATNFLDFDVSEFRGFLLAGRNVLALQALNIPTNSPDLILLPQLDGITLNGAPVPRYFPVPTPGRANNPGVITVGPIISAQQHTPARPADGDDIIVTAQFRSAFAPLASASLRYRVMFGSEVSVPLLDDGAHHDGAAGDGLFGASIPAGASVSGQMVRWHFTATDTTGTNVSRLPSYTDTNSSPAYFGTVIANPALTNPLPVFHWFVQNVAATDTTTGTRCSVFWDGEFYDNVFCRVRGASAVGFAKKPYKFDFNPGEHFRFQPGQPRVDELNLNSTYHDKSYVRSPLSYETYRRSGSPASDAFNVRVQQNNGFYSVAVFVEQVDETYLNRRGLNPEGALYKMYNTLNSASSGVEKKLRRNEGNADLQEVVSGVSSSNPNRAAFVYDRFDMPALINYLAAGVVVQDLDRTAKNYYLYRDSDGTGLWRMLPWDKDLTFGLFGLQSDCLSGSDDTLPYDGCHGGRISHPFFGSTGRAYNGGVNNLFDIIFNTPTTRAMFLRRLRTLMDEYLQAPGSPANERFYERRLNELSARLQPDTTLDLNRWRAGFGLLHDLNTAVNRLKIEYLEDRRRHLYQTHGIDNVGQYPDVAGIPHAQLGSPALAFGAIEFNPASANPAQEYVELLNPNPVAVDISGWTLEGGVDFSFQPGTVVPPNGRIYVSPDLVAFRARTTGPRGGQGLLVVGAYTGQLSARGEILRLRDTAGAVVVTNSYAGNPSPTQRFLRITELMYHPAALAGNVNDADEFEFIKLKNISTTTALDLHGVRFVNGLEFSFTGSAVTTLPPGATALVVKNTAAFTARYGLGLPIAGQYLGSLDNNGDRLQLLDASNEEILDFSYDPGWYPVTDGLGFSLVSVNELAEPEAWDSAVNWRPSGALNGSPTGADPAPPALAAVVINEVLPRVDAPPPSAMIELFNPTAGVANIGGWFLTDDISIPKKFRIPNGTIIPARGFLVFNAADFNPSAHGLTFNPLGSGVWLFSADAQTNLTGYLNGFSFGAAEDRVSFGRYVTSVGETHFVAQSATTPGGTNSAPRVGPVVISEIHYHPPASVAAEVTMFTTFDILLGQQAAALSATEDLLEFVELQNITTQPVPLYDPQNPGNTWRLRGDADYDFPANVTLAPGARLLLVNFDPATETAALAAFRAAYGLDATAQLFGPYSGSLANSGARVELQKPDAPRADEVPRIMVDSVRYSDIAPWPAAADGDGSSLQRLILTAYGNDPTNWFAAGLTPGSSNVLNFSPTIAVISPTNGATFSQPVNVVIITEARDSDGTIGRVEFLADDVKLGEVSNAPFNFTWTNASFGSHILTARATDNRLATTLSAPIAIQVLAQPPTVGISSPTNGTLLLSGSANVIVAAANDVDGFIAKVEFFSGLTKLGEANVAPYVFVWTNAAPGNYTLTAVATDNGGFTARSAQVNVSVVPGSMNNLTLISPGAVWKYFDQGVDLGTTWRASGFNDAAWPSGPAQLGYGDGDEATTNGFGPDANNKFVTTYYRRTFNVTGATAFGALSLRLLRDDGAVVYLNGTEIFRSGMPEGPIAFNTIASITVTGEEESTAYVSGAVNAAFLSEGVNVVAVEIHQAAANSSDISFDLELSGGQTFLGPVITTEPVNRSAPLGATVTFDVSAGGTGPLSYQWRRNGTNLAGASGASLSLTNVQQSQSGSYSVVVSNQTGTVTSQAALLGVFVAGNYAQTVLADAPIHYYRFEETGIGQPAADLGTPGGRNGIYNGGITLGQPTAPALLGHSARFSGNAGTFVDLGLFHPGDSVTVEVWASLDPGANHSPSYHDLVGRMDGSYVIDFAPGDRVEFAAFNTGGTLAKVGGDNNTSRGQWHHLVGVFSGGTATIYVDGVAGTAQTIGGALRNLGPTPDRVLIGASRDGSVNSFNFQGLIDEVAFYNRALPPERVLAHYQGALPGPTLTILATGEIRWPLTPAGYVLQVTDRLSPPVPWQNDLSARVEDNGFFKVTVTPAGTNRFYRLIRP